MDQITRDIRRQNWANIIKQCQQRPSDITVKAWLADNGIGEKAYYYWLRKFRKEAYSEIQNTIDSNESADLKFAEIQLPIPAEEKSTSDIKVYSNKVAAIKANGITIEISNDISDILLHRLIKEVVHA
ncbi:MAG: IS66 family insertion sequence element accessory protein TnpB [Lachnospiraceae bacterium]|nr:IS66 family insertion sequence element accessory protein TnpB [Lachnospiraceae bacterium]